MVIGAVVLAIALAALVFMPRSAPPGPAGTGGSGAPLKSEPILSISPSAIEQIQITWGASTQRIIRGPLPDTWLREWTDASNTIRRWPVAPSRVRGGLRLLHETTAPFDVPPLDANQIAGTIRFDTGKQSELLQLANASLDGRRHATRTSGSTMRGCLIPDQIATLFDRSAVGEWLERSIFPGITTPVARVTLKKASGTIELGRVASTWSLRAPFVSTIETARMNDVLLALETFTISRVTESLQPPTTEPTELVQAEVSRPTVDGDTTRRAVVRYSLHSWPAPDDRTREVPARALVELVDLETGSTTPLWGPVDGVVSIESVAAANVPLTELLGRRCLNIAPADIAEVRIEQTPAFSATRSGDRWATPSAPIIGAELDALSQFLKLLCDDRADSVRIVSAQDLAGTPSTVTPDGGSPINLRLRLVGSDGGDGTQVLFVRTVGVERGYDLSQRPTLRAWLVSHLPV